MPHPDTIRRAAVFVLVEASNFGALPQPVAVELAYDPADPLAVQAAFRCGRANWIDWIFSRDLLRQGTAATTAIGEGDVCVRRSDENNVELELRTPTGHARLTAPLSALWEFLNATYELVPVATEGAWLDLDLAVHLLLSADLD